MTVSELKNILKSESKTWKEFSEQLKTNSAFIYYLKSDRVIFMPGDLRDESTGILFEDKKCYQTYLNADSFPIENPDKTIYEKYQEEIFGVNHKLNDLVDHLTLVTNIPNSSHDKNETELPLLLDTLKKIRHRLTIKDKFYTALVLGEYLRSMNKGSWILLKRYGKYNPFYVPAIYYPESGRVLLILDYFSTYFDSKSITLDSFSKMSYIQDPVITFESLKFSRYPDSYLIPK
ncbi:MAG: hypothetical protein JST42_10570 [Bacteroidetes bacterium]|nr:hypothetical protein [Bacteroidota bacterium]